MCWCNLAIWFLYTKNIFRIRLCRMWKSSTGLYDICCPNPDILLHFVRQRSLRPKYHVLDDRNARKKIHRTMTARLYRWIEIIKEHGRWGLCDSKANYYLTLISIKSCSWNLTSKSRLLIDIIILSNLYCSIVAYLCFPYSPRFLVCIWRINQDRQWFETQRSYLVDTHFPSTRLVPLCLNSIFPKVCLWKKTRKL